MTATNTLLEQGISAAQSGDRPRARTLLMQLVEQDERHEQGWLWLAGMMDDPEDIRTCLENVLDLNPNSAQARQGLVWVEQRFGPRPAGESAPKHGDPRPHTGDHAPQPADARQPNADHQEPAASHVKAADAQQAAASAATPVTAGATALAALPAAAIVAAAPKRWWRRGEQAEEQSQHEAKEQAKREAKTRHEAEAKAKHEAKEQAKREAKAKHEAEEQAKREARAKPSRSEVDLALAERTVDITEEAAACPYCGEMNAMARTWCSRCEQSLMIRNAVREQRSVWVSITSVLWKIGGAFGVLAVIAALVLSLIAYFTLKSALGPKAEVPFPTGTVAGVLFGGILSAGQIVVARAYKERERWAFWIVAPVTVLNLLSAVLVTVVGMALLREALGDIDPRSLPAEARPALGALMASVGLATVGGILVNGIMTLMVGLSWRDFYGPMVRFIPEVKGDDDAECFNIGLACKSRKMWFMAVRQWEAAVRKSSRDADYLHALGLAYAQLRWFDKARSTLDHAAQIAPANEAIHQSRARLEHAT